MKAIREVNESVTVQFENPKVNRLLHINTDITYTVPKEKKEYIWNIISEGKLLELKRRTNGWAEKMESSGFARFLGEWVYTTYENAFRDNPDAENQTLELDVSNSWIAFHRLLGQTSFSGKPRIIKYKDEGYKDLSGEEQLAGLRYAIYTYMAGRLSKLGSEFTTYSDPGYDHLGDKIHYFTITPHFPKKELKEW